MDNKKGVPSQLLDQVPNRSDHETVKEYFNEANVKVIRGLLVQYLNTKVNDSVKKTDDPARFAQYAYSEHQAYQSGYRSALRELIEILDRQRLLMTTFNPQATPATQTSDPQGSTPNAAQTDPSKPASGGDTVQLSVADYQKLTKRID